MASRLYVCAVSHQEPCCHLTSEQEGLTLQAHLLDLMSEECVIPSTISRHRIMLRAPRSTGLSYFPSSDRFLLNASITSTASVSTLGGFDSLTLLPKLESQASSNYRAFQNLSWRKFEVMGFGDVELC